MRKYTEKGRVVYDRPKHHFDSRDLLRCARGVQAGIFKISPSGFSRLAALIAKEAVKDLYYAEIGGGGAFGGGGATRTWQAPAGSGQESIGRIIIMVENRF